ncbi:MAG TPA: deoxyguanosinetriphosphate triphosphohydrolase [Planctomycetes bacterium]|nr:deoxyguanosinetriphosphate triphosphohydrolase [Planctomycetota bacterium]
MIRNRQDLEALEDRSLASYAARSSQSRGRRHDEPPPSLRTAHQRDRDRVLHSEAFRRLQHKTQVFVVHEGDHYRTRLTHTLEVSQISRSLASFLGANISLANCIALMHDLGHPPYGHMGEVELNELAQARGLPGFDHNLHALRVIDHLERRYDFPGLNLTWEAREGIAKHMTTFDHPEAPQEFSEFPQPGVEAQIASMADTLAYVSHDLEDALFYGFFTLREVQDLGLDSLNRQIDQVGLTDFRHRRFVRHGALTRLVIGSLVQAALEETERRLIAIGETPSADDVRRQPEPVVALPDEEEDVVETLIGFLLERVYRHPSVEIMCEKGRRLLRELFGYFCDHPAHLPRQVQERMRAEGDPDDGLHVTQTVLDFLAGITDRHAVLLHQQVFSPTSPLLPHID